MANDDFFDDPSDPHILRGFYRVRSSEEDGDEDEDLARVSSLRGGVFADDFNDAAGAGASVNTHGRHARPSGITGVDSESILAAGRAAMHEVLSWGRRQIGQHYMTALGLLLVFGLLAVVCANGEQIQALASHGLSSLVPGNTVESPLNGRNGPSAAARPPSATSTGSTSPGSVGGTPTAGQAVNPGATPSTPVAPPPTTTPKPPQPPTATPKPTPQVMLDGKLTVRATNGASCNGGSCAVFIYAWIGNVEYGCGTYAIKLPSAGSTTVLCRLPYTAIHSIPAGALSGICAGCGGNRSADITWVNPSPFYLGT